MINYIFFDTETTGLTKPEGTKLELQPFITELYAVKTDEELNTIGEYHQMFKVPIDVEAKQPGDKKSTFEITGISNAMLADKNPFSKHWREIADFFLGTTRMIAHNLSYDKDMLRFELMRLGKLLNFPWAPESLCTIEKSMHFKGHRLNLGALHQHLFGVKFEGAHRAKSDVEALIKCYKEMRRLSQQ